MIRFAIGVVALLCCALIIVLFNFRQYSVPSLHFSVRDDVMPGNEITHRGISCEWDKDVFQSGYQFCHPVGDPDIQLIFDRNKGVISYTSYMLRGQDTVGDAILAWGTPIGLDGHSYAVEVVWPDRFAYVIYGSNPLQPFGPRSPVYVATYGKYGSNYDPWRGFLSVR